jgi:hypothetical protein
LEAKNGPVIGGRAANWRDSMERFEAMGSVAKKYSGKSNMLVFVVKNLGV